MKVNIYNLFFVILISFFCPTEGSKSNAGSVEEITWADEKSYVVHLTDENFEHFLSDNPSVLVMFYAPWCGHCKTMKSAYVETAKILKERKSNGILAAVDATKEKNVAEKYDIKGFPTLKYFKDGKFAWDFIERTTEALLAFMNDPKEPPPPPEPEMPWSEQEGPVVHLTEGNFKTELKKRKHALVMFYAPWCGHCKHAKPDYISAADQYTDDPQVLFAAVDCTLPENRELCRQQGVQGFPTLRYYGYFKSSKDYSGGRSVTDFKRFMDTQIGTIPESESPAEQPEEEETTDDTEWGYVKQLTWDDYYPNLNSVDKTLVLFYSPRCRFCEIMKPDFIEAAATIKDKPRLALAAVNCVKEEALCQQQGIAGYPSVVLYRKGTYIDVHRGKRVTADFVRTITTVEENADAVKPPSSKPKTEKTEL